MKAITAKDAARAWSDFVNNMTADEEGFAEAITNDHRTLQQSSMRVFMLCIKKWAACHESGRYDGRNEFTCKLAAEIMKLPDAEFAAPFI